MRAVIELKRDAQPMKVLNNLFKHTALQSTFGVNMLALVERGTQPRVLTLKRALQEYIEHRQEVITRRTEFELERARRRAHILEGLKIALDNIDAVIATIRNSRTTETRARQPDEDVQAHRGPGQRHPRHAPRPPRRPGAQEDRGRAQGGPRRDHAAWKPSWPIRSRSSASSATTWTRSRRSTATSAAPASRTSPAHFPRRT